MAQIVVQVNGRDYPIACADGEEEHVRQLAAYVDGRLRELVNQVGQIGETQLLLMTALNIADDLSGAVSELEEAQQASLSGSSPAQGDQAEAAAAVEALAERLERIAARLETS